MNIRKQKRPARPCTIAAILTLALTCCAASLQAAVLTDVLPEYRLNMQRLYGLNIPNSFNFNTGGVPYYEDNSGTIPIDSYSLVGYYLEVQRNATHPEGAGPREWVWASFDIWDQDAQIPSNLGVPASGTGVVEDGTVVENMTVLSNAPGITTGEGFTGIMEFWGSNYGPNGGGQYNSNNSLYDWRDGGGNGGSGYGSMQIANITTPGSEHMLFGFNRFNNSGAMGIGSQATGNPDWTFGPNASTYDIKNIEIWVGGRNLGRMVPEPSTTAMLVFGVGMLQFAQWVRRNARAPKTMLKD